MNEKLFEKILGNIRESLKKLPGAEKILDRNILCHIQCGNGREFFCKGFELESLENFDFLKSRDESIIIISLLELGKENRKKYKTKKKKNHKAAGEDSLYFFV